ncbi:MAG: ClbS/DfsB family four-helix bundle protein [Chloroflexota bacterium]
MNKSEFLSKVNETYQEYLSILASLSAAQMLQPRTCGEWSVKDVIAHVTWHEREMVGVLKERALVGSDLWNLPLDQRNAVIYESNKDLPLAEVLSEAESVHRELLEFLAGITDEDLLEARHFREMPPDWIPWEVFASNTFEHYPDHVADIRKAFPLS